jgi:hypothetical protein
MPTRSTVDSLLAARSPELASPLDRRGDLNAGGVRRGFQSSAEVIHLVVLIPP